MASWRKRTALLLALALVMSMVGVTPASAAQASASNTVSPASPNIYRVGDVIDYVLTVGNPSTEALILDIWDIKPDGSRVDLGTQVTILPGASVTYNLSYMVRAQDVYLRLGKPIVMNKLYAVGIQANTNDAAEGYAEKSSAIISPDFSIAKTVDFNGDGTFGELETNLAGEKATWKIVVTNTGDSALKGVTIADTNGMTFGPFDLAVGASHQELYDTFPMENTVNTATVNANDSRGTALTPKKDDAAVVVTPRTPDMSIDKSADATRVPMGTKVNYTFVVTNTGNETLYNLVATDDKLGQVGTADSLEPGKSVTFTKSAVLNQDTHNIVTVDAWTRSEQKLTRTDDWTVIVYLPFVEPDLAIEKVADKHVLNPGDTVKYTLTYRNVGEGPATDFTITDDYDERYLTIVDSSGGVVADGKIVWNLPGPLTKNDAPRTITYTAKVKTSMPAGTTNIDNVVVIRDPEDKNPANDRDDERVKVTVEFLPFTGGETTNLLLAAAFTAGSGLVLRRKSRRQA